MQIKEQFKKLWRSILMTSKELANHLSNTAVICKLRNNIQVQKIGKLNQWIDKKRISNILKTLSFRIMHRICKRRITILSQQLSDWTKWHKINSRLQSNSYWQTIWSIFNHNKFKWKLRELAESSYQSIKTQETTKSIIKWINWF